jgi:hypothetical protein
MAYVPIELTGPPPGFLVVIDENELINALKAHADFLLTRYYLHILLKFERTNYQIKHIVNIFVKRYR